MYTLNDDQFATYQLASNQLAPAFRGARTLTHTHTHTTQHGPPLFPLTPTHQALTEAAKLVEQSKAQVVALESQLAKLAAEKPLDQITIDEFLATKPDMKKKIDDEIKAHNYI
jgi:hypothetical protein